MTRFDYYMERINAGDYNAVADAENDVGITNAEYWNLWCIAEEKAYYELRK